MSKQYEDADRIKRDGYLADHPECEHCAQPSIGYDVKGYATCEQHADPDMWSGKARHTRHMAAGNLSRSE